MNFAVIFLNMPALYMLWRAQILTDLHAVFCVHQIRISAPPQAKNLDQKVSRKNRILPLKIAFFWVFENDNILSSKSYTVTKSEISPQRQLGSLRNLKLILIRQEVNTKFFSQRSVYIHARKMRKPARARFLHLRPCACTDFYGGKIGHQCLSH